MRVIRERLGLKVGLDVSFDKLFDCKGIRQKFAEINSTKARETNDEASYRILNLCHVSKLNT
jgi:hypothetical protein